MMGGYFWMPADVQLLRGTAGESAAAVATLLGRTAGAVTKKRAELGICSTTTTKDRRRLANGLRANVDERERRIVLLEAARPACEEAGDPLPHEPGAAFGSGCGGVRRGRVRIGRRSAKRQYDGASWWNSDNA